LPEPLRYKVLVKDPYPN